MNICKQTIPMINTIMPHDISRIADMLSGKGYTTPNFLESIKELIYASIPKTHKGCAGTYFPLIDLPTYSAKNVRIFIPIRVIWKPFPQPV